MDVATVSRPEPARPFSEPPAGTPRGGRTRRGEGRLLPLLALAALLAVALLVRLWGIEQGLPYSYNTDEAVHFVPRAVGFFSGDLNPHYFLNPPGYSYLLYAVFELWFGGADAVRATYATDPTAVFVVARVVAAVLGTGSVLLTYLAGARLMGRAGGLLAAAILGFGFLPVF